MRTRSIVLLSFALLATVAFSVAAPAQNIAGARFGLRIGAGIPLAEFDNVALIGVTLGGHYQRSIGDRLGVRVLLDYGRYRIDDIVLGTPGSYDFSLAGLMTSATFNLDRSLAGLYAAVGLGAYSVGDNVPGSVSEMRVAYDVGIGYERSRWFAELRYLSISGDRALTTLPVVLGRRF